MVRGDEVAGLHLTTETEGWRRVWPFTHSDLSRTGDGLSRVAEAEAILYCVHYNILSPLATFLLYAPLYHTCTDALISSLYL